MKIIISESQLKRIFNEQRHSDFDMFDDEEYHNDSDFQKFDPDYFDQDEYNDGGFSPKMHQKSLDKKIKRSVDDVGRMAPSYSRKKDIEVPRDEFGKEKKWSPLKKDDMSLGDYLKSKK